MIKPNLSAAFKTMRFVLSKHSPEILTGIGIAGMITTTILAVKATPKAVVLLEEAEELKNSEAEPGKYEALTPVETVKETWKCYIPALITGSVSIACLIGASSVNVRRNAALATAYKLSEAAFTEYREKAIETIGEKKEKIVRDKITKGKIDKDPITKKEVIITEKGNTVCYDVLSGRYFKSDIEKIKRIANELNRRMLTSICSYISLNEFYDELGLEHVGLGDELGWNIETGLIEIDPGSHLAEDGTPCLVMDFRVAPRYNYC